jgi:NAD+ kinase
MNVKRAVIVTKPKQADVAAVAQQLVQWFAEKGIGASIASTSPDSMDGADLCVVVGGDGTLLAAARLMGDRQLPILAINHGGLGFLTEVTLGELYPALDRLLADQFVIDRRMMIDVTVHRGKERFKFRALNDAVLHRATLARIVELEAWVDGQYVTSFRGDGLIVATPTGSTAHNLSAGGPIVFPTMGAMVMTPICPHTLTNRPIVLPPEARLEVMLKSTPEEVHVTVDGQRSMKLEMDDRVVIEKSTLMVNLIAPADKNYFDVLRGKLKWG